jgi:hypothetical protein
LLPGGGGGSEGISEKKYRPAVRSGGTGRGGRGPHLASMYTLAISTRSVLTACGVGTGREGQRWSHFAGRASHLATAVET